MTADTPSDLSGLKIDRDAPSPPSRSRRTLLAASAATVLVAVLFLLYRGTHPSTVRVLVARAEALGGSPGLSATEILTANGYVVARQRASVSTEVAGRLERLYVEEGSRVRQGQVLGVLQNQDQRSALASSRRGWNTRRPSCALRSRAPCSARRRRSARS